MPLQHELYRLNPKLLYRLNPKLPSNTTLPAPYPTYNPGTTQDVKTDKQALVPQGSDGYHRHWKGYGQVYTGPIHEGKYGGKDYLQIQDLVTGEVEYFRFRFT
jgi:hypothetical protein